VFDLVKAKEEDKRDDKGKKEKTENFGKEKIKEKKETAP
jgi:hypothetical protein